LSAPIGHADGVSVSVDGAVGRIVLDRPERLNAITLAGLRRIIDGAEYLDSRGDLKVVVVSGAAGMFTAGMDLSDYAPILDDPHAVHAGAELGAAMCDALEAIDAVTVAAIEGRCVGGGVLMAASCDIRIATADALFSIPELSVGVPFTWRGVPRLMREMGPGPARELILTGRVIDAAEARRSGLVGRIVSDRDLEGGLALLLEQLTSRSRRSLLSTKQWMRAAAGSLIRVDTAADDSQGLVEALADEESATMMRAYFERLGIEER
jgi:enoyl-CoA hydratase/carnithine racemase